MYKVPKCIPIAKHLAKHFNGPFSCLGGNTEKYITFSICKIKKSSNNKKSTTYQMKFIDSLRHMSQSLSNLVDNLAEPRKNLPIDTLINRF